MHSKINSFLKENSLFSFSTSINNIPYCASCFYTYSSEEKYLVFKSKSTTKHIINALSNNSVAGTILSKSSTLGEIKGIQFNGTFIEPTNTLLSNLKKIYYKQFPFALPMSGDIWAIEITSIKMTDNTLGIGKKILWQRENIII